MPYSNPLRYFSTDQKQLLLDGKLTSLKKEILLQFQLAEGATIYLQGEEIDKNSALALFDELSADIGVHQYIAEHKHLYNFLTRTSQFFLTYPFAVEDTQAGMYSTKVRSLVIKEIVELLDLYTSNRTDIDLKGIKSIGVYTEQLTTEDQDACYSKLFSRLNDYVDRLWRNFDSPLDENDSTRFRKDHVSHLQKSIALLFRSLPDTFESIARKYSLWCYKFFVLPTVGKGLRLSSYSRPSLEVLRLAALIAGEYHSKAYCGEVAGMIRQHLSRPSRIWSLLLLLPFIFISVNILFEGGNYSKDDISLSNTEQHFAEDNLMPSDSLTKLYDEEQILKEMVVGDVYASSRFKSAKEYNGSSFKLANMVLVNRSEAEGLTELYYECDVLPTSFAKLKLFIPKDDKEMYPLQMRTYVCHFLNRKLESVSTSHKMQVEFKPVRSRLSRGATVEYIHKTDPQDGALQVLGVKNLTTIYPLRGCYESINGRYARGTQQNDFSITYLEANSTYKVTTANDDEYVFHRDSIVDLLQQSGVQTGRLRFATIIHNYNLLEGVVLGKSAYTVISDLYKERDTRRVDVVHYDQGVDQIYGCLSYKFTSAADSVSYVEIYGKGINIRYLVDYTSGETIGMHMTTIVGSNNKAERVQLFSTSR